MLAIEKIEDVLEDAATPRTPEAEATIGNGWSTAAPTGAKSAVKSSSKKAATKQRRDGSGTDRRPKNSGSGTDRRPKGTLQLLPESVREALDHSRKARGNHNGSDTSRSRSRGTPSKHTIAASSQPLDTSDLLAPPDPMRLALARVALDTLQSSNFQGELLRLTAAVRSAEDDAKEGSAARQLAVARAEAATAERMHAEAVRLHAEKAAEALLAQEELLRDLRASKAESSSAIAGEAAAMAAASAAQAEAARLLAQVHKLQAEGEQKEDAYAEELQRWVVDLNRANALQVEAAVREAVEKVDRKRERQAREAAAREVKLRAQVAQLRRELAAARGEPPPAEAEAEAGNAEANA